MEYSEHTTYKWKHEGLEVEYDPENEVPIDLLHTTDTFEHVYLTMDELRALITILTSIEAMASRRASGRS